jgi:hypothetical protein
MTVQPKMTSWIKFVYSCRPGSSIKFRDMTRGPLVVQLREDETRLNKAGIVRQDKDGNVIFASHLAERFYRWLFPNRAACNPKSLHDLLRKMIGSLSASMLKQSVVHAMTWH